MAGCQVQGQRRVAERELLTIGCDHVALWFRGVARIAGEEIPVGGREDHVRVESILKIPRTT
jgi:hypothetical protein